MKTIVYGINGVMGQIVASLVKEKDGLELIGGVDPFAEADDFIKTSLEDCEVPDLIIDFSHHSQVDGILDYAVKHKVKVVVATTNLSDETKAHLVEAGKQTPVFFSANYSYGVLVVNELLKIATQLLEHDFDIEIIEKHHKFKIDAPSGTAKMLLDTIIENSSLLRRVNNGRKGEVEKKSINDIGVHAVRGGTIVGEHTVLYSGLDELIEIKHTANSKAIFASGAIKAGLFLSDKSTGYYTMQDLL